MDRRAPPRCPGPVPSTREPRIAPATPRSDKGGAAVAGCSAHGAAPNPARRRTRHSDAGRTRRSRAERDALRISRQLVAGRLGQVAPAVDPVHDLQRAVVTRLEVRDELHELVGLPVQVQPVQRPKRKGRIAHPRVAAVPVALAARSLGKRRRKCRDGRAGRHVSETLDCEGRSAGRHRGSDGPEAAPGRASHTSNCRSPQGACSLRRRRPATPGLRPGERALIFADERGSRIRSGTVTCVPTPAASTVACWSISR